MNLFNFFGTTASSSGVSATPPVNYELPQITGSLIVGETLTCSDGLWYGSPAPTFTYLWYPTSETTSVITPASDGDYYCVVTATNSEGSDSAASETVTVGAPPGDSPVNTEAPVISGDSTRCSVLTCSSGSWDNGVSSYNYHWLRNASEISDATDSSYTITNDDVGQTISCRVEAVNGYGSTIVFSGNSISGQQTYTPECSSVPEPDSYSPAVWQTLGLATVGSWSYVDALPPAVAFYSSYNSSAGVENSFISSGYGGDQTIIINEELVGQFIEIIVSYTSICGETVSASSGKFGPVTF